MMEIGNEISEGGSLPTSSGHSARRKTSERELMQDHEPRSRSSPAQKRAGGRSGALRALSAPGRVLTHSEDSYYEITLAKFAADEAAAVAAKVADKLAAAKAAAEEAMDEYLAAVDRDGNSAEAARRHHLAILRWSRAEKLHVQMSITSAKAFAARKKYLMLEEPTNRSFKELVRQAEALIDEVQAQGYATIRRIDEVVAERLPSAMAG